MASSYKYPENSGLRDPHNQNSTTTPLTRNCVLQASDAIISDNRRPCLRRLRQSAATFACNPRGLAFCTSSEFLLFLFWHLKPLGAQVSFGQTVRHCARLPAPTARYSERELLLHFFLQGLPALGSIYWRCGIARAQVPFHPAATARPPEGGREQPQGS